MNKLKPFRCQNPKCSTDPAGRSIFDFWAAKPVCPKCGTDGAKCSHVVIALTVVHFDPPSNVEGRGLRIMACTRRPYGAGEAVTGHPEAVNCQACQATAEWQKHAAERGIEQLVTPDSPQADEVFSVAHRQIEEIAVLQTMQAA